MPKNRENLAAVWGDLLGAWAEFWMARRAVVRVALSVAGRGCALGTRRRPRREGCENSEGTRLSVEWSRGGLVGDSTSPPPDSHFLRWVGGKGREDLGLISVEFESHSQKNRTQARFVCVVLEGGTEGFTP